MHFNGKPGTLRRPQIRLTSLSVLVTYFLTTRIATGGEEGEEATPCLFGNTASGWKRSMGGCCAENCANNSRDGYRLFRLPKEQQRRQLWLRKINRKGWEPGEHAKLCEVSALGGEDTKPSLVGDGDETGNVRRTHVLPNAYFSIPNTLREAIVVIA